MITSIEISRLRGIREGKLENLTPLVVLAGPNGCGKSTVLDALLIGASPDVGEGVRRGVLRHAIVKKWPRWLFWRGGKELEAAIVISADAVPQRRCVLTFQSLPNPRECAIIVRTGEHDLRAQLTLRFKQSDGAIQTEPSGSQVDHKLPSLRLVETLAEDAGPPLDELLTACTERGQRPEVARVVEQIVEGVKDIVISTERDIPHNIPVVHLEYVDHSVPAAVSGDGVCSLLRICLELVSMHGGTILLEEPEAHQHPAAIRQTVLAIINAIRQGTQVILTTHSIELIDAFLAESSDEDLENLAVYRLELVDGTLVSVRNDGTEVSRARGEIARDLR